MKDQNREKNRRILAAWERFQKRLRSIRKKEQEIIHEENTKRDRERIEEIRKKL